MSVEVSETKPDDKVHPWRVCQKGHHFVRTHTLQIPPSKEHPDGEVVTRHEHCAKNPTPKEMLSFDEIQAISSKHFVNLNNLPNVYKKYKHGGDFDREIAGWVKYWSDIFKPKHPLDSNLIKAIIASESSFRKNQDTPTPYKNIGNARGLMQITDSTREIIADHKAELRNHYIQLSEAEVFDPSANICAGVRWLFRKKTLAKHRLHHEASWMEAVAEYKGVLKGIIENKNPDPLGEMDKIKKCYKEVLGGKQQ